MDFKGDISGLEELIRQAEDEYYSKLIEIGKNCIRIAQNARGSNGLKEYQIILSTCVMLRGLAL